MGNLKNGDSIICFKCQKYDNPGPNSQILVPVNAIAGNIRGKSNCITTGSDGVINMWDYIVKNKAAQFQLNYPITRLSVSPDGYRFVYALGYDWHQGFNGFDPSKTPPLIFVHYIKDEELQSKKT